MKLTHVCIITGDLNRLTAFYEQVLQVEPVIYRKEYVEFPLAGGATLSLYSLASHERLAPGTMEPALNRSVELEFEVEDVEAQYLRLLSLAIDWVLHPPFTLPWGHRAIYFRDPDGNLLNFYTPVVEG